MLNFSTEKLIFAMYSCYTYRSAISDKADQNSCFLQADATRERKKKGLAYVCPVLFQTHQSDAFLHLSGAGTKWEGKERSAVLI